MKNSINNIGAFINSFGNTYSKTEQVTDSFSTSITSSTPSFTKVNYQPLVQANDVLVNLKNVSNINVLEVGSSPGRIVFNMNYTIDITRGKHKRSISDYVYWDAEDLHEMDDNVGFLDSLSYIQENFIKVNNQYINTNEISSIKFIKHQKRIIFNLSHPVTFRNRDNEYNLTSEFVYINCDDVDEYTKACQEVNASLGLKG